MTDLSYPVRATSGHLPGPAVKPTVRKYLPYVCVVAAGLLGFVAGRMKGHGVGLIEPKLLILMEFMAALKFLGALAGAVAMHWRRTYPIHGRWDLFYMGAVAAMAAGAGLIGSLGAIVFGAAVFHAGLVGFLVLAWRDDGVRSPGRRQDAIATRRPQGFFRETK